MEPRKVVQMMSAETDFFVLDNEGCVWVLEENDVWRLLPPLPLNTLKDQPPPQYSGIG